MKISKKTKIILKPLIIILTICFISDFIDFCKIYDGMNSRVEGSRVHSQNILVADLGLNSERIDGEPSYGEVYNASLFSFGNSIYNIARTHMPGYNPFLVMTVIKLKNGILTNSGDFTVPKRAADDPSIKELLVEILNRGVTDKLYFALSGKYVDFIRIGMTSWYY